MKFRKSITTLVTIITMCSLIATVTGIFSTQGEGEYTVKSIFQETVHIYGKGLYQHDSVSMAAQAIAQDYVTLFLGIPLLLFSLYFFRKGSLKGKLLLTGTLGYFFYTYASYSFLSMYNSFFLIDVLLMSASFFAFTIAMMSFDIQSLPEQFSEKIPVRFIGGFLIFVSIVFGIMWLGRIVPPLLKSEAPVGIEHYTTMVIQALDLGFVVPISILAGILLINRRPFGYLLSSVMIVKEITLLTALSVMIFLQMLAGIKIMLVMFAVILLFNIVVILCMFLILRNIRPQSLNG